jgi:ankyrin repeat protein
LEVTVQTDATKDDSAISDAVQGLHRGDFSRLEPLFDSGAGSAGQPPRIIEWYERGLLRDERQALADALTCACFLGKADVAEYFLVRGVDPSGGAGTGLTAFHWAANRGHLTAVRLLIQWNAPLETRSMYGGNVLDTAVWSAIHEPRPDHLRIIAELLEAGARLEDEKYPTGREDVDLILARHEVSRRRS